MTEETLQQTSIKKQFFKYVSLNILAMIGTSCYILADTFFIANGVGADGLTALNVAISLYSCMFSLALMVGIGGATRFAVCKSRRQADLGNKVFSHTLFTGLGIGLLIATVVNFLLPQIAALLGAEGVIHQLTVEYMRVIFTLAPFVMMNQIMAAYVRNDGNPKLATIALLISNASNIVLDYVFIYPMNLGMLGAAMATGVSPIICLCLLSTHVIKRRNTFHLIRIRYSIKTTLDFCKLGVSSLVNELSIGLVVMIFNFLFFGLGGNTAVAAYGVVANCAIVGTAIFTGIAQGVQPLVSDTYGRGQKRQLKQILLYACVMAIVLAVVMISGVVNFDDQIVDIFNKEKDPLLQEIARGGLCIYFASYLAACFNIVFAGYLSAMERADFGFAISLMRGLVVIAPMAFVLSKIFGMTGIWIAVPAAEAVTLIAAIVMVRKAVKG